MLSSDEVADVVATLIPHFIDSSAGNPGACFDCPAGSSDADNDPTTACTPCAAGKFSSAIGVAGECAGTCPAGQSFDGTGAVDDQGCTACVAGTYENGGVCTGCPAGKFSAAVGATDQSTCVDCAAGLGSSAGGTECIASGCTDNLSPNYSADAVVDDGSCEYTCDALRTSLDITAPGGCLIYDSTTSGWKNYNADGTLSTTPDATFVFPPEQEHWIVQGLPLAGSSDGAFLYPSYPSNLMVRNARMTVRYVDVSDNNCSDGDCAPLTGYAAGISIEAVTPCTFASPAREKWCFLDVDHASMNNNYADVSAATCQQTEINGDGTMATRSSSMKYVTYTANSAGDNGAAAWVGSGTHIIQNNVYDGNVLIGSGTQIGGALFLINNLPGSDCWLLLESSAFKNNAAIQGGAIFMGTGTKASLSQVTFDSNQAKSIGGAINMLATAALEMRSTTFVDNMANGQGATVYSEQPLSIKIVDADFSANGGSDSVHIAGTTGDCSVHPCDPGQSCAYTDYSLTCTACPDNTYSTDGITCGLCPDGQTPSADKTSCEACPAETIASSGFCATAPAPTVCEECEVTPCPAVTPAPAPTTSEYLHNTLLHPSSF
jgi:predicted outer membrane repeat protein